MREFFFLLSEFLSYEGLPKYLQTRGGGVNGKGVLFAHMEKACGTLCFLGEVEIVFHNPARLVSCCRATESYGVVLGCSLASNLLVFRGTRSKVLPI